MNCSRSSSSIARQGSVANARSESGMLSNHVSPGPPRGGACGRATIDPGEAQAAQAGQLADELGVTPEPVSEELLLAEPRLAADKTDPADHSCSLRGAGGRARLSAV